jgi:hypothetical protein
MDAVGSGVSGIRVASPVNVQLREMRMADPQKAQAVDDAIRHIPSGAGEPIQLDLPEAPPGRQYRAIVPHATDAPVVIYRSLEPSEHVDGNWLVTTLVGRDQYREYRRAEMNGLLDTPEVRDATASLLGTVSSILVNSVPGDVNQDGDPETGTSREEAGHGVQPSAPDTPPTVPRPRTGAHDEPAERSERKRLP